MIDINDFSKRDECRKIYIAVFLDYLNQEIQINSIEKEQHFNFDYIYKFAKSYGAIVVAKAYGDWNYFQIASRHLEDYNFELVQSYVIYDNINRKDCTDSQMITDIIDTYHTCPEINFYFIISGDIDFLPAVKKLKERENIIVVIISDKDSLNHRYKYFVDKVVYYQDLLKIFNIKIK